VTLVLAATAGALLALPAGATAARLVGGKQQAAITRAFFRQRGPRGRAVVSIRSSSVSSAWTVVRWVLPTRAGGRGTAPSNPRVFSTYFHAATPGQPPARVSRDLASAFRVTILYTGTGTENVDYGQLYRSVCSGGGGFIEQERDSVSPAWRIRYTVQPDRLLSAVRGRQGLVLVPTVSFDRAGSRLTAVETRTRTYVDQGCFDHPTNYKCVTSFNLTRSGSDLGFVPGAGAEIGIPMRGTGHGQCGPEKYTLGPSLWDSGGATAAVRSLGLVGGRLPAMPYAAMKVSWPRNSAPVSEGSLASPCQGIKSGCSDQWHWRGSVRLETAASG
jgi:hypothetical protein